MGTSAPAVDDLVLNGYFNLDLTGLESLKFTNISGLTHQVLVSGGLVSANGTPADMRAVTTPEPVRLTMTHVVLTTMDLWTWLSETITAKAGPDSKKSGTLSIMPIGGAQTPLKTWNLDDVYLDSLQLDSMGAGGQSFLTATLSVLVGQCTPA